MLELLIHSLDAPTLLLICAGVIWGMIFGMIPGLTSTLAVVVLIPVTYGMNPVMGMSMLIGIYIGGISGGLVTAILIGMPGTPSSITTAFDGFPLAKQGQGGRAIGLGVVSNLVGCLIGWICLVTLAPQIARFALNFGPFEYVAVIIFGLTAVISLSGKSLSKGIIIAILGLLISTIGLDPTYSMPRNTFGFSVLRGGVSSIPAMIGLFVISQVFTESEHAAQKFLIPKAQKGKRQPLFNKGELKESIPNFARSGMIGMLIGILPGIGGSLSNFIAYDQAKKASKDPDSFGKGNIQGVIASETANNATIGGALIPMLALGIPGDAVTASLLGGLQLHGLEPGPLLLKENPEIVYGIFASFLVASVMMFAIMMMGRRVFPSLLRIQKSFLLPLVLVAGIVGCYNLQFSLNDVWVAVAFGLLGYGLKKGDYPITPMVISLVLGDMLERNLRMGLLNQKGDMAGIFTRPIVLLFLAASVISVACSVWKSRKKRAA